MLVGLALACPFMLPTLAWSESARLLRMNLKYLTFSLLALGLAGVSVFRLGAQKDTSLAGRFVLMQSEYQTQANNTRLSERTMLKMDTSTGKAWRLVSAIRNGSLEIYWDPISEVEPKR